MSIKKKNIITGALILTSASIITRLLGFVYRIYMSNTLGAEGMGLYQLIMPLYSLGWSIACSGFTTTISKLVAQENAKHEYGNMGRVLKQALLLSCGIALLLAALLYGFSPFIAETMLHDARVDISLKILAIAFPFMAAGSCIRGYFLGLQQTTTPAISQVFEQVVRMAIIYLLSATFISRGLEYACAAAVIGILFGELLSFLYILYTYRWFKIKNKLNKKPSYSVSETMRLIIVMATPLGLNKISGSLLTTFENLLIPQRLQMFGYSKAEAISLYGQITGMALPLILFPSALLMALSTTLIPAISEAVAVNNKTRIIQTVSKSMLFTAIVGIGACTVFLVLPKELGMIIYKQDISQMLFLFGMMCPLMYMNMTFSGILNGLGQQVFMFRNSLLSSAISIGAIFFLVPKYGFPVFIFGWFLSLFVVIILELMRIKKCTQIKIPLARWFIKPILSALATGLVVKYLCTHYIFQLFGNIGGLLVALALLCICYLFFILVLGVISIKDIQTLFHGLTIRKHQQAREKEKAII